MKQVKQVLSLLITVMLIFSVTSCTSKIKPPEGAKAESDNYRNFYEIFVYSFCDSDGDGIGDLNGVTSKLDYILDMGYDAIWLMPIMPSTTYHKYDVIDYYGIDPEYGTMDDFENLIDECDKRGIKLLIELMLNHTSSENKWFKEALEAVNSGKDNKYVDYYNFVDTDPGDGEYKNVGVTCGKYYEAHFADFMPDLNFDNEAVRNEFKKIAKFWIKKGVDGFRLDAIKHAYNDKNKNIELCKWFNGYCKSLNKNMYIVGEVWSTADEVMDYYGGDFTSLFNFGFGTDAGTIAYQTFKGYGASFAEGLQAWQEKIHAVNPDAIDAVFLTNHDNMRIASRYDDETLLRAMAKLYLLLPGTIYTYYGEEIGMVGEGIDENKRGPMDWTAGDEACKGPEALSQDTSSPFGSVEEQQKDEKSMINFYKSVMAIRNKYETLAKGTVKTIDTGDDAICAYTVTFNNETLTVIHNFVNEEKAVKIDGELLESIVCESENTNTFENGQLILAPYGAVILK